MIAVYFGMSWSSNLNFRLNFQLLNTSLGFLSNSVQLLYKMVGKVLIMLAFKRVLAHLGLILLWDKSKEESEFFTLRVELRK